MCFSPLNFLNFASPILVSIHLYVSPSLCIGSSLFTKNCLFLQVLMVLGFISEVLGGCFMPPHSGLKLAKGLFFLMFLLVVSILKRFPQSVKHRMVRSSIWICSLWERGLDRSCWQGSICVAKSATDMDLLLTGTPKSSLRIYSMFLRFG